MDWTFTKLDFTALVISKSLYTKAQTLAYVQECGTTAMQVFACKNQKKLGEFIDDAWEWDGAKRAAAEESLSDWDRCGSENDGVRQQEGHA